MKLVVILVILYVVCADVNKVDLSVRAQDIFCGDPDCDKDAYDLILSKGYPAERHTVLTSDGYELTMHRIPHGRGVKATKGPVYLQHGLLDASHTWVLNFPEQSLGFILADAGYDVWLGNVRGNIYSMKNIHYSTDTHQFWNFTFDQFIDIDLPTMIDFVLKTSNSSDLFYVGHSQGTMMGFGGFLDEKYVSKVKLFVALSPVAYVGHITPSLFHYLAKFDAGELLTILGFKEFLPKTKVTSEILSALCKLDVNLCEGVMCAVMGCNTQNWNNTRWPVYAHHDPAGTSVKNMIHFSQLVKSNKWQRYDYGEERNMQIYHQKTPPKYNLADMKIKLALFTGGQDYLADPTDVTRLINTLPPTKLLLTHNTPTYSHLDPIWGLNASQEIYNQILILFNQN